MYVRDIRMYVVFLFVYVCNAVVLCIDLNMWVDYRGSLSTVYNDGEISTCGWIIEVHSVQSTMMGRSQHVGRL